MKLEVGMYVKTNSGYIYKLSYYDEDTKRWICNEEYDWYPVYESNVIKASHNIIDLIEAGDYVNGLVITRICEDTETKKKYINLYGSVSEWEEEDIKSIVTKEQFESMSYKIGD